MNLKKLFAATFCLLFLILFTQSETSAIVVSASGDPNAPSHVDDVPFNSGQFSISSAVAYDNGFGQWLKRFIGPGGASGDRFDIVETIDNAGSQAWTDWHERVVSTTDIGTTPGSDDPGFLFDKNSLFVFRNNVLLSQGSDYLLLPQPFNFGPTGNPGHWSAFDIFFQSGSTILPGDTLRIEKQIFEVFGDGDTWMPGEFAIIAQFPTIPEPSALILAAAGALACSIFRQRAKRE